MTAQDSTWKFWFITRILPWLLAGGFMVLAYWAVEAVLG